MAADHEQLRQLASRYIQQLASSGKLPTPISASELLAKFISSPFTTNGVNFRLTDSQKLETILEEFANSWDAGLLSVQRDKNGLSLTRVILNTFPKGTVPSRKRKRQVDEDADSAEETEVLSNSQSAKSSRPAASLSNLSRDLQEIYALLRKGTAWNKLLAEQVCCQLVLVSDLY